MKNSGDYNTVVISENAQNTPSTDGRGQKINMSKRHFYANIRFLGEGIAKSIMCIVAMILNFNNQPLTRFCKPHSSATKSVSPTGRDNSWQRAAFSLIEILQTVVLLGIIAGLSVSFFTNFNNDDRLFYATENQIRNAVQQMQRDMCNDVRPYCKLVPADAGVVGAVDTPAYIWDNTGANGKTCSAAFGNDVTYNPQTGYCEVTVSNENDPYPTVAPNNYPMTKDVSDPTNKKYIALPRCNNSTEAIPYGQQLCQLENNGVADLSANNIKQVNGNNITNFCSYAHKMLNHKTQHTTAGQDLGFTDITRTCNIGGAWQTAFNANPQLANLPPANLQASRYSMILPNGAILYMDGGFQNVDPNALDAAGAQAPLDNYLKVYIKYDRIKDLSNLHVKTDGTEAENIKGSNIWCIWIRREGQVYRCASTD